MSELLACLGFPAEMDVPFMRRLLDAARHGQPLQARGGTYVRWSPGAGVEVWLLVENGEWTGTTYHYAGAARARVRTTARVREPGASPLAGTFHGELVMDGYSDFTGIPFVFAVPDFARFTTMELQRVVDAQLTAFALDISGYATIDDFDASPAGELGLASNAFIPLGLFGVPPGEQGVDEHAPEPVARFAGEVLDVETPVNPFSEKPFVHARVRTADCDVDLVAHPESVSGPLRQGCIVYGDFWLSARLPDALADIPEGA